MDRSEPQVMPSPYHPLPDPQTLYPVLCPLFLDSNQFELVLMDQKAGLGTFVICSACNWRILPLPENSQLESLMVTL
jgi:hypothetical protein